MEEEEYKLNEIELLNLCVDLENSIIHKYKSLLDKAKNKQYLTQDMNLFINNKEYFSSISSMVNELNSVHLILNLNKLSQSLIDFSEIFSDYQGKYDDKFRTKKSNLPQILDNMFALNSYLLEKIMKKAKSINIYNYIYIYI